MADGCDTALQLPAAALHHHTNNTDLHPDSVEAVRRESIRTARELGPIGEHEAVEPGPSTLNGHSGYTPNLRARGAPSSPCSSGHGPSQAPTATDSDGPDDQDRRRYRLRRQVPHWYDPVVKFWTTQISVTIDEGSHRDHLALERTFLGYLRTSVAFAMTGVIISQLFRLQHAVNPNLNLGFFVLGIPLSATFICFAMFVLLIGAFRFWSQQSSMARGKVRAGGWEISVLMACSILLCAATFVLIIAIDIEKSY